MKQSLRNKTNVTPLHKNRIERTETADMTSPNQIIAMQRMIGNAATKRLLQRETPGSEDVDGTPTAMDYEPDEDGTPTAVDYEPGESSESESESNDDFYESLEMESESEKQGFEMLEKLKDAKLSSLSKGGDSGMKDSPEYPDWFNKLQQRLVLSVEWTHDHEAAQNLLYKFAVWKETRKGGGKLNPALEHFFRYIGRSAANTDANAKYKDTEGKSTEFAGQLGAKSEENSKERYAWCANATSAMIKEALTEKGLMVQGGFNQEWFNKYKMQVNHPEASTAELKAGDQISFVGSATPPTGHVATVIRASGDSIQVVSGNAGGVKGGSIRLEQVNRVAPPGNYIAPISNRGSKYTGPDVPTDPNVIWIFSIVRLSNIDLSQIDPNDDAVLKENGLMKIPPYMQKKKK
jgi:hypothetical protein